MTEEVVLPDLIGKTYEFAKKTIVEVGLKYQHLAGPEVIPPVGVIKPPSETIIYEIVVMDYDPKVALHIGDTIRLTTELSKEFPPDPDGDAP